MCVFFRAGADVNVQNFRGETPLHHAARNEFQKLVEVLLVAGADPTQCDNDRNRPLDLVSEDDTATMHTLKRAMQDREAIIRELLDSRGSHNSLRSLLANKRVSGSSLNSLGLPIGRSSSSILSEEVTFLQQLGSHNRINMSDQLSLQGSQGLHRHGSQTSFTSATSLPVACVDADISFVSEAQSEPVRRRILPVPSEVSL